MDYDIPTELSFPENLICVALDSGHAGKSVLKILDDFGFAIVPKEPTMKMKQDGYVAFVKANKTQVYGEAIADHMFQAMLAAAPSVHG